MAGIQNILPNLCKLAFTNYKYLKKGVSTLGQQVNHSVKTTYKSMSCQSADNIVGSSESTQHQEAYSATKIQSLTRGHLERKSIKQQNNAATKIQSLTRGHLERKSIKQQNNQITVEPTQTQHDVLRTTLDNWVNEAPNEREVRQRVNDQIKIDNGRLEVNGDLDLSNTSLTSLPQGLHVTGWLDLSNCTGLTTLPQGLHVGGGLFLDGCKSLTTLPQDLHVGGGLFLDGCTSLTTLPQGLHVGGNLKLADCTSLTTLPQGLHVTGWLDLAYCTGLTELPQGLCVSKLTLKGCTGLTTLPQGLHVTGWLNLSNCTRLTSLPQNLHVGGDLNLNWCSGLTSLPQNLHVGGKLWLHSCTSLTELPDWVFNTSDLNYVPDNLEQTDTYKTFQILKHFDTHDTIDDINNQELIGLYNQNQNRINTLQHNRHCFRIAYSLCNKKELTPQQQTFKDNDNEQTKNQIRDHLVHMITSFKPNIFKKLPGINNPSSLSIDKDKNGNVSGIGILPFVANFGFLPTAKTQGLRMVCKSFNERDILDQKEAYKNNKDLWPSLHTIEQILQA